MRTFNTAELNTLWQTLLVEPITEAITVSAITTDSRTANVGETFFVVSGEQFDAHQFIPAAIKRGVNAVVVEKKQTHLAVPQVVVRDTRLALACLATAIRRDFNGTVVGLTGSAGKTTTKQMLLAIFSAAGKTHATKGNLNNDLGVPFTWFALPEQTQYAVIEMGANHLGEIDYLTQITRPNVGVVTNAGEAHLAGFGRLDGVAQGKGELFARLGLKDTAVINDDDAYAAYWQGLLAEGVRVLRFSLQNPDADVYGQQIRADGSSFTLCYGKQQQVVQLPCLGLHNVSNALAAAACAIAANVGLETIAQGLAVFETAVGRLQRHQRGEITIIDDSYNANPLSMRACAEIVQRSKGYRVMVIADMGELGQDSIKLHAQLGESLKDSADAFFCVGENMRAFVEQNSLAKHFETVSALYPTLQAVLSQHPQATVLIKGSRSMEMERVVDYLLNTLN